MACPQRSTRSIALYGMARQEDQYLRVGYHSQDCVGRAATTGSFPTVGNELWAGPVLPFPSE